MGRFKDSLLKDKKYWKETLIVLLVGIIINVICFFMSTIYSKAVTLPSGSLPFNVTDYKDVNPILTDSVISSIYSNSDFQTYIAGLDNYILYISDVSNSSGRAVLVITIIGNPYTDRIYDSNYDYLTQRVWYYGSSWGLMNVTLSSDGSIYNVLWRGVNNNLTSFELLGVPGTQTNSNVHLEFTPRYPFAIKNTIYDSTGNNYVFVNAVQIVPGEFTDLPGLDEILNNLNNNWEAPSSGTGHALPSQPTENPNNNDFQNRLQMFDYLKDSINSIIGNLGYNLKNWFDNLMGKMVEGFNSVSQNIWNGFKTLMDNIKDFFGAKIDAIIEKFNYITEPLDQEEITDFIETSDIYSDVSTIQTSITTFGTSFTGVTEPDDYTLTFHIENIDILNQSSPFVLHLNILDPVKSTIRAFLWVIVSYGLFISVVDSLPNYINGGGGEDD